MGGLSSLGSGCKKELFLMTKLMWLSEWVWERGIEGLEEGNLLAEMNV